MMSIFFAARVSPSVPHRDNTGRNKTGRISPTRIAEKRIKKGKPHSSGYTLTELMIAAVVGSVLMMGAVSMIVSHTRTAARSEALIRLQDAWSRIQFLLDQEIQEARGTPTISSCSSLSFDIPNDSNVLKTVTYSLSGTTLNRTGPRVLATGRLDNDVTDSNQVVMTGVTSFCPTQITGEIEYTMTLRDATGVTYQNRSQPSGAHTRSRIIN